MRIRSAAETAATFNPVSVEPLYLQAGALETQPIKLGITFWCYACGGMASNRTCPHGESEQLQVSGTQLRKWLSEGAEVPESVSVNVRRRSFTIAAAVDVAGDGAEGVLFSQGARAGGHALYVKDGRLHYTYNWLGEKEQTVSSSAEVPAGSHVLTAEFQKTGDDERTHSALGTLTLYVDTEAVGSGEVMTQPGMFGLSGSGAAVGRGNGSSVSSTYEGAFPFTGGTIDRVVIDVSGDHYVDHEKEVLAYLARD